jgi:hypothetical protein
MWDPLNQRSPTGGYPWRIEDTSTTKTYIKNITDREQYYVAHLNWENGGEYVLGMKKLLPHQTIEIDIKQLRDNQTPDEAGRTIPLDATKGQLKWSMKQVADVPPAEQARQQLALIGRTEQIDIANGISSNYACQNCCGDSYYDSFITPFSAEIEIDEQVDFDVYQIDEDCYGELTTYQRTPLNGFTSWSSSDTSVATVNDSIATAVGDGNATITATWTDYIRQAGDPCPPPTPFAPTGEQCTTDKEQPLAEKMKDEENQAQLAPGCGGCQSFRIYPRPFAYLSVRPPRITNVTAEPTQDVKRVTQIVGNQNIFHFATPKGAANSQVTLTATVTPNNQRVLNQIDWEGATESPTNPLQATVPKETAAKHIVKIKHRGRVLKELRVWVVWATISGSVQSPVSTAVFSQANLRIGSRVSASFASVAVINPASIITDADRPNFSGANTTAPPGGTNAAGQPLSGGANMKWDMSRRIAIRATVPNPPFNPPILVDRTDNFPNNPVIGNDDAGVGDEINNPYTNNGQIESEDEPTRGLTLNGGNIGDNYRCQLWFQEFARLEIQGTWYVISESQLWRVDYRMEKQTVTERLWNTDVNGDGDLDDIVTEAMLGQDTNGDGDLNDDVGYWAESGSTSANDNAGAPQ